MRSNAWIGPSTAALPRAPAAPAAPAAAFGLGCAAASALVSTLGSSSTPAFGAPFSSPIRSAIFGASAELPQTFTMSLFQPGRSVRGAAKRSISSSR
jgi:hypothetical protein